MSYCCTSSRQLSGIQKESKLWKELYLVEKRCRKVLEQWTLQTFGFDVKLDYEKVNSVARIQAIENKEAMKNAAFPNESAEGEMKVVVMEIKITAEDLNDEDEAFASISTEVDIQIQSQTRIEIPTELDQSIHAGSGVSGYPVIAQQQQYQTGPIEIAATGDTSGTEQVVYIGNYEDGSMTEGQPYYILKSDNEDEIPIQFDYSSFINNGDVSSTGEKVFYRIATPAETSNATQLAASTTVVETSSNTSVPSVVQKPATKRKPPAPKNVGSKPSKAKKQSKASSKASKYIIVDPEPEINNVASTTQGKSKKDSTTKSNENSSRSPLEFGLTLREKAEIYVRTKAKDAIRKVGGGYECTMCLNGNYSYSSVENAMTHTKTHYESKPYKCEFCEEIFSIQRELLHHRKTSHPKPKGPAESKSPTKHSVLYSQQYAVSNPSKPPVVRTSIASPPTVNLGSSASVPAKSIKPVTLKDTKKQFKCQVGGCQWSYATAEELGWHMKAHSQARV